MVFSGKQYLLCRPEKEVDVKQLKYQLSRLLVVVDLEKRLKLMKQFDELDVCVILKLLTLEASKHLLQLAVKLLTVNLSERGDCRGGFKNLLLDGWWLEFWEIILLADGDVERNPGPRRIAGIIMYVCMRMSDRLY